MSTQASLFEQPAAPKRVRETSITAYQELLPKIVGRNLAVLTALAGYLETHADPPTSAELMKFMGEEDPNRVRPRLSDMSEIKKGLRYVELSADSRRCTVKRTPAHTWKLTRRGELFLRGQR